MDLEGLKQAVAQGESESLELKKTTGDLKGGMKTLCAMLNGAGGRVVYGVTPGAKSPARTSPTRPCSRLEVASSGLLPQGITVADLKREHESKLRNPLIAGVFYRCGLIEQWGRGTQKIVDWCVAAGQPEPDFEERAGDVVVRFRPSGYHPPLRISHDLTDRQRRILHFLGDGQQRRLQEIHGSLQSPPAKRTLLDDLKLLRQIGLVASGGRGVGAKWWLIQPGDQ